MTAEGGQRSEGKSGEGERKGCWCFADALGVVEILQQRPSPLLSNVHLVLQILRHQKTTTKRSVKKIKHQDNDKTFCDTWLDAGSTGFISKGQDTWTADKRAHCFFFQKYNLHFFFLNSNYSIFFIDIKEMPTHTNL